MGQPPCPTTEYNKLPSNWSCVGHLLLGMGLGHKSGLYIWWNLIREHSFSLSKQWSNEDSFWFLDGGSCLLPSQHLNHIWLITLFALYTWSQSLGVYAGIGSAVYRRLWFLVCSIPSISTVFTSSVGFPEPQGEVFDGNIQCRNECSSVFYSLHIGQLRSVYLFPTATGIILMITEKDSNLWA